MGETRSMKWAIDFAKSSIGAKFVMAITGFAMIGFVLAHMVGNLQLFSGQTVEVEGGLIAAREALNAYGDFLQNGVGSLLWVLRFGILGALLLHLGAAIRIITINRKARPSRYKVTRYQKSTVMSRYMGMTGLVILAFVIFHLAHFTWGWVLSDAYVLTDPEGRHDIYNMVVLGFQNHYVSVAYIIANAMLGLHLGHAGSSMMQTLGLFHEKYNPVIRSLGGVLGAVIFLGNASMPIMVWLGFVQTSGV